MLQLAAAAPMARPVPSFDEVQEPVSKIARAFMGCSAPTEFQMDVLMTEASRVKKRSDYQDQDACRSSTTEEFLNKRWKRFNGENHNETKDELSILCRVECYNGQNIILRATKHHRASLAAYANYKVTGAEQLQRPGPSFGEVQ